jgi:hypothetical protein
MCVLQAPLGVDADPLLPKVKKPTDSLVGSGELVRIETLHCGVALPEDESTLAVRATGVPCVKCSESQLGYHPGVFPNSRCTLLLAKRTMFS